MYGLLYLIFRVNKLQSLLKNGLGVVKMKSASVRKKDFRAAVRRGCWMLKDHCMFGPEPNVTHTASWQQPCHGDVYTDLALLFTIQHSHHRACSKLPLWKFTVHMCVCVKRMYFCGTSLKSRHRIHTHAFTPTTSCSDAHSTYPFIKFTPCTLVCIVLLHPPIQ